MLTYPAQSHVIAALLQLQGLQQLLDGLQQTRGNWSVRMAHQRTDTGTDEGIKCDEEIKEEADGWMEKREREREANRQILGIRQTDRRPSQEVSESLWYHGNSIC